MNVILVIAAVWLVLGVCAMSLLRVAALGDRADERRRRTRRTALMVVAVPLAGAAAGASAPDVSAQGCAGARSVPGRAGPDVTLCLINAERRARGLAALAANGRLARAASYHAVDMVARRYFAHTSPGGSTVAARLKRVGYPGRCTWWGGETIAWASGAQATPRSRVAAWMRSRPHRRILLDPVYREAGVGIAPGAPNGSAAGFTYTVAFGRRRC